MQISLSDHFTYQKLLRFVAPSILMMIITSIYSIVDGFFVSNFVGKNSFAALNLIFPVIMALAAVGFMIGTCWTRRRTSPFSAAPATACTGTAVNFSSSSATAASRASRA